MKKIPFLLIVLVCLSLQVFSQKKTYIKESFKVLGNCMMCKNKIEGAATNIEGVKYARWDVNKKLLKVKYKLNKTNGDKIQQSIAEIGYDTELFKATDKAYSELHYCCKYERE